MGRADRGGTVATEVAVAEVVAVDHDDVGRSRRGFFRRGAGERLGGVGEGAGGRAAEEVEVEPLDHAGVVFLGLGPTAVVGALTHAELDGGAGGAGGAGKALGLGEGHDRVGVAVDDENGGLTGVDRGDRGDRAAETLAALRGRGFGAKGSG